MLWSRALRRTQARVGWRRISLISHGPSFVRLLSTKPNPQGSKDAHTDIDALVVRIRELGTKRKWSELYSLCTQSSVAFDDLLARCKDSAHKVDASSTQQRYDGGGRKAETARNNAILGFRENKAYLTTAFTDVLDAHIHSSKVAGNQLWHIMAHTHRDPVLAGHVGVRRLWRACRSQLDDPTAANDAGLKILSRWLIHAGNSEKIRSLVVVLMRSLVKEETDENIPDKKMSFLDKDESLRMAWQLMRTLRQALDEELPGWEASGCQVLGNSALYLFHFWCQRGDQKTGAAFLRQCMIEKLLEPHFFSLSLYTLTVTGALHRTAAIPLRPIAGASKGHHEDGTTDGSDESKAGGKADGSSSHPSQATTQTGEAPSSGGGPQLSVWTQFGYEPELAGLDVLLAVAHDNSVASVILRQKFFHVLFSALQDKHKDHPKVCQARFNV